MASRTYTAQEMRKAAARFAFEEDSSRSNTIAAMLRQAADALEREEKRVKTYEYGLRSEGGFISRTHSYSFFEEYQRKSERETILRREVGEWEEVKDGE